MNIVRTILVQVQFLTRIPVPSSVRFDERTFARGVIYAPLAGFVVGLAAALTYGTVSLLWRPFVPALAGVIMLVAVTGALHLDGLADSFDALMSARPKEKLRGIMKDPHLGTHGVVAIVLVLLSKWVILAQMNGLAALVTFAAAPIFARATIAWIAGTGSYPPGRTGMARELAQHCGKKQVVVATVIALVAGGACSGWWCAPMLVAAIGAGMAFGIPARKKIGGVTGDLIGAGVEISETAAIFAAAVLDAMHVPGPWPGL